MFKPKIGISKNIFKQLPTETQRQPAYWFAVFNRGISDIIEVDISAKIAIFDTQNKKWKVIHTPLDRNNIPSIGLLPGGFMIYIQYDQLADTDGMCQ